MKPTFDNGLKSLLDDPNQSVEMVRQAGRKTLQLPFKPFTLDEVKAITGCRTDVLDAWAKRMGLRDGCGVTGLDYAQTFGVFCGWRFLEEGAEMWRGTEVAEYVSLMSNDFLTEQIAAGNTFVVTRGCFPKDQGVRAGMLVRPPDNRLGRTLNLKVLLEEFGHRVKKVFPNG